MDRVIKLASTSSPWHQPACSFSELTGSVAKKARRKRLARKQPRRKFLFRSVEQRYTTMFGSR